MNLESPPATHRASAARTEDGDARTSSASPPRNRERPTQRDNGRQGSPADVKAPEQNRADVEKTGWMGALHHPHTPPPHGFMDHGRAEPGRFGRGGSRTSGPPSIFF